MFYRAYLHVIIEAENLGDAYNRIEIEMMRWPKRRWRYVDPVSDDWVNLEIATPHPAPDELDSRNA